MAAFIRTQSFLLPALIDVLHAKAEVVICASFSIFILFVHNSGAPFAARTLARCPVPPYVHRTSCSECRPVAHACLQCRSVHALDGCRALRSMRSSVSVPSAIPCDHRLGLGDPRGKHPHCWARKRSLLDSSTRNPLPRTLFVFRVRFPSKLPTSITRLEVPCQLMSIVRAGSIHLRRCGSAICDSLRLRSLARSLACSSIPILVRFRFSEDGRRGRRSHDCGRNSDVSDPVPRDGVSVSTWASDFASGLTEALVQRFALLGLLPLLSALDCWFTRPRICTACCSSSPCFLF